MVRGASFIKAVENLRSAATRERMSPTMAGTGTRTCVSGGVRGVFDYMFDMFEQVNGAQSTLKS